MTGLVFAAYGMQTFAVCRLGFCQLLYLRKPSEHPDHNWIDGFGSDYGLCASSSV